MGAAVAVVLLASLLAPGEDERSVRLDAAPAGELGATAPTLDELEGGDVLTVRVDGGVPGAHGDVEQCRRTIEGFVPCTNRFPMLFDEEGDAVFQYRLDDVDGCGPTGVCVVVVRDRDREREAYAFTVFGAPGPSTTPDVRLTTPGPYAPGDEVRLTARSLAPGTAMQAALCEPECGAVRRSVAGADGTATVSLVVPARCGECVVAVVAGSHASRIPLEVAPLAATAYDGARLVGGLVAAVVFLLLAWRIIAVTDWRPPSEAATPELDQFDVP